MGGEKETTGKLDKKAIGSLIEAVQQHDERLNSTDQNMRLVINFLIVMVAGMVITNTLWVIEAFFSKDRPQEVYNYTVENDPISETAKDKEIERLKKENIRHQLQITPIPEKDKVKLEK